MSETEWGSGKLFNAAVLVEKVAAALDFQARQSRTLFIL